MFEGEIDLTEDEIDIVHVDENGEIITLSGEGEDDVIETMDDDVLDKATESDEE